MVFLWLALAAGEDVALYFGCGCFWHVQHELIAAERSILGRSDAELTATSGYAGGSGVGPYGLVCYHGSLDDYAKLGHTEVVHVSVPSEKVADFAKAYWGLFVGIDRVDTQDQGPEYRAAIGVPPGLDAGALVAAQEGATSHAMQVRVGAGSDGDTLGQPLVWVYDTERFPFFQAELFHQFHDARYSSDYHALKQAFTSTDRLWDSGCQSDGYDERGQQRIPPAAEAGEPKSEAGEPTAPTTGASTAATGELTTAAPTGELPSDAPSEPQVTAEPSRTEPSGESSALAASLVLALA